MSMVLEAGVPITVALDDARASDAHLVGAKAANLARAEAAGLPVLPGVVLTTIGGSLMFSTGALPVHAEHALRRAWRITTGSGQRPVVVRSSSTIEDTGASSMAGQFTTVLDVAAWPDFIAAVRTVLDSATHPGLADAPMAVLVQPFLDAVRGGVMFGGDPVSGNADHLVVATVAGDLDHLVGGQAAGTTTTMTGRGRLVDGEPLDRRTRRRLAGLAARAADTFGGPQDVEWALDRAGKLWMLQSRPITTPVHHPQGHRFGTGPVAETFPEALAPLERDLWMPPLRDGLREALRLSGSVAAGSLAHSPLVVDLDGQVAADLDLLDPVTRHRFLSKLDPRPGARRLRAAWRVGRLRAALPALATDVVAEIDGDLLDVGPLGPLSDGQLLGMLGRTQEALCALHGHEVLAGVLFGPEDHSVTGADVALQALAEGRRDGLDDASIVERDPVVLALVPPRIGPAPVLPPTPQQLRRLPAGLPDGATRETLRVRARWVHELAAATAWELARRFVADGRLTEPELVRWLTLGELAAMVDGADAPADLAERVTVTPRPLPTVFRLSGDGGVVADRTARRGPIGAGGGRNRGPVHLGADPAPGSVLVVATLDPSLAPVLPGLAGLVAETGNPLSHLAILAREYGVATVVGVAGALADFHPGDVVEVDGVTGTVTVVEPRTDRPEPAPPVRPAEATLLPGGAR